MGVLGIFKRNKKNNDNMPSPPEVPYVGVDSKQTPNMEVPNIAETQPSFGMPQSSDYNSFQSENMYGENSAQPDMVMDEPPSLPESQDISGGSLNNDSIDIPDMSDDIPMQNLEESMGSKKTSDKYYSPDINELNLEPAAGDEMPAMSQEESEDMAPIEPLDLHDPQDGIVSFSPKEKKLKIVDNESGDKSADFDDSFDIESEITQEAPEKPMPPKKYSVNRKKSSQNDIDNKEFSDKLPSGDISDGLEDYDGQIEKRIINDSMFVNVEVFRNVVDQINSLSTNSRMAEESLFRIKDVTLAKEKVFEKWHNDLEQIEKELIQLDKLLFNI